MQSLAQDHFYALTGYGTVKSNCLSNTRDTLYSVICAKASKSPCIHSETGSTLTMCELTIVSSHHFDNLSQLLIEADQAS